MTPLHQRPQVPLLNLILSGAALAVLTAEVPAALRAPVLLAFVLVGLGLSVLQFLSFGEFTADLSFALAAGLALVTALTAAMLYLVGWSPQTALLALALCCMALALTRLGLHLEPLWHRRGRSGEVASSLEPPLSPQPASGDAPEPLGRVGERVAEHVTEHVTEHGAVAAQDLLEEHGLIDAACTALLAVLCGANSYTQIHQYALAQEAWLRTFLTLPSGVPSPETFERLFAVLSPEAWQRHVLAWTRALVLPALAEVEGSASVPSQAMSAPHLRALRVWSPRDGLLIAQRRDAELGRVAALAELVDVIDLEGAVVTTGALEGRDVAWTLREHRAHYVLALREHPELLGSVRDAFGHAEQVAWKLEHSYLKMSERRCGREESHECWVAPPPEWLPEREAWRDLTGLVKLRSSHTAGDDTYTRTRYFLSSLPLSAEQALRATRFYAGGEQGWRWVVELPFDAEQRPTRRRSAQASWRALRQLVAALLSRDETLEVDPRTKRLRAGWDRAYLFKLLFSELTAPSAKVTR